MTEVKVGDLVFSIAGHDKGKLYLVHAIEGKFVKLVNGKERKITSPKVKNIRHVKFAAEGGTGLRDEEIAYMIKNFDKEL